MDDAATHIMGGDWRMPTMADFNELLRGTTNEWVTNYKSTGVSGRKFTSRANGNSIFIPAAGYCNGGSVYDVGSNSRVWSSLVDFDESPSRAWMLYFDSDDCFMSTDYRSNGLPVRGVRK